MKKIASLFLSGVVCLAAGDPSTTAREIIYHETDTPTIYVQLNYVTSLHLPGKETIMSDAEHPIVCGNKDFFEVRASGNVLYVKPLDLPGFVEKSTGGKITNVEISLASGNHMGFRLVEVSHMKDQVADLKVFIKEGDNSQIIAAESAPKFVPADQVAGLQAQIDAQKEELRKAAERQKLIQQTAGVAAAQKIDHSYRLFGKKGHEDFHPAIFRDGKFTYIDVGGTEEAPSVWELKDGKLAKVDAILQDGKYTIQHLVDEGELQVGKSRIKFKYQGVQNS